MDMTPQAKKLWEQIPSDVRVRLLNNVYCVSCKGTTGIAQVRAVVEKGDLILHGRCTRCDGEVARLIESD